MIRFRMRRGLAGLALACSLATAMSAGCAAGPHPGPPVIPGRQALAEGTERALGTGSVRFVVTLLFEGFIDPKKFDGALSWSNGVTGEVTDKSESLRFTSDAVYMTIPPGRPGAVPGKRWIKRSFAEPPEVAVAGFIGALLRAAFAQANPARNAATLIQAGDLRVVGTEQRNGVEATRYAGTVEVGKLVADPKLGLTDQMIAELKSMGIVSEQLDLWLDQRGFPVRVESRARFEYPEPLIISVDYHDYGGPGQVAVPPENEVIDAREADKLPPR